MTKMINENLSPEAIKNMSLKEMELLSYEIRDFLIENVSKTGGHLASNLGIVELTIALHRVFDTPSDKIVWDVGHQAYVHKIITGRADKFITLRQTDGLSGFPKRKESEHDTFDSGHSSNSVSAALGMAIARDLEGEKNEVIAVIGDGALTGGMAFEALNNAGDSESKLIVVLNDNEMSISSNTGGITKHLSKLRTSKGYLDFKKRLKNTLKNIPSVGDSLYRGVESLRDTLKFALVDEGAIFESLGFTYLGPIDGHNIEETVEALNLAKRAEGPVLLHVTTKKGKGYKNAEMHPDLFHGIGVFDQTTGVPEKKSSKTYSDVFGEELCKLASENDKIVGISAAMIDGTGLAEFEKRFPDRMFDVGIAEQHAVTFAAGLALSGFRPVVAVYSTFLQRGYDQIMVDVCLQNLPVIFAVDRAGVVGNDGETHHGIFDISYFYSMPNLTVLAPADGSELKAMMKYALSLDGPCAIRYPRGNADNFESDDALGTDCFDAKSAVIKEGADCEIWAVGKMVKIALEVSEKLKSKGYDIGVVNAKILKPLDEDAIAASASRTKRIVTLEDNVLTGGFGHECAALLKEKNQSVQMLCLGWPDKFIEHGNTEDLFERYGLSSEKIAERISGFIER